MSTQLSCTKPPPTQGVVVLTNMQWFYGPTWGRTLRVCERLSPLARRGGCAKEAEVRARQLELIEVLRRNAVHSAVAEVHVLLGEAEPVRRFLARLPWYERHACKLTLVETGTRPRFVDYMRHLSSSALLGKTVVLTNQDVLLADGPWAALPTVLPPKTALFLSRYHVRYTYDVGHSLTAGTAEGLFNATVGSDRGRLVSQASAFLGPTATHIATRLRGLAAQGVPPLNRGTREYLTGRARGARHGLHDEVSTRRVCDMTTPRFAVWRRSLCTPANFGSFDAYVLRLEKPLSPQELDLFDYPQNAWGGENLFLFLVRTALGHAAANPCKSLQAVHVHCELPTEFGVLKVGDKRLGKREIVERAKAKMRQMGRLCVRTGLDRALWAGGSPSVHPLALPSAHPVPFRSCLACADRPPPPTTVALERCGSMLPIWLMRCLARWSARPSCHAAARRAPRQLDDWDGGRGDVWARGRGRSRDDRARHANAACRESHAGAFSSF